MDDLNEGIKYNDLRGLIKNVVSIDQYKSKAVTTKMFVSLQLKLTNLIQQKI